MKILITGANGMVARTAVEYCRSIGDEVIPFTRRDLDIADGKAVSEMLAETAPDAVLNCAAFTDVDGAESAETACYAANSDGVENLALACKKSNAAFVTISTDYVFGGSNPGFYTQHDTPNPQSVYARSKLEGEIRAKNAYARSIIVRSGWIYGPGGNNFLSMMPKLLAEGKTIKAIVDAYGTPTYGVDLARRLRELVELDLPCIFHVVNSGPGTSFLGFAEVVCDIAGFDRNLIKSVSKNDLKRPAPRPDSSKLACLFSERFGLEPLPDWKESLARFLECVSVKK
jgi:dTDP-4-dehydrorhamnose reductase